MIEVTDEKDSIMERHLREEFVGRIIRSTRDEEPKKAYIIMDADLDMEYVTWLWCKEINPTTNEIVISDKVWDKPILVRGVANVNSFRAQITNFTIE